MQLLIVIAGLSQRVDRIRTGYGGKNNSEGATPLQGLAPFIFQQVFSKKFQRRRHTPTFEEKFEMSHTVMFTEGAVEERLGALEKYLTELQLHRDSRRGLEGARGEKGEPGISNVPGPCGPAGRDGKDADITLALKKVREELDAEYKILAETVRHELKISGVIDENGVAIPGPVGPASTIPGPKGDSIVGGVGRDGHDAQIVVGDVAVGEKASVSVREENGVHVLDFVLPRAERGEKGDTGAAGRDGADSNVQGPRGEIGPEGIQGIPGVGLSKLDVIALVTDMKRRGSL